MSHCAFIPGPTICKLNGGFKCVSWKKSQTLGPMIQLEEAYFKYFSDGWFNHQLARSWYGVDGWKTTLGKKHGNFNCAFFYFAVWCTSTAGKFVVKCFVFFFSGNVGITIGILLVFWWEIAIDDHYQGTLPFDICFWSTFLLTSCSTLPQAQKKYFRWPLLHSCWWLIPPLKVP